MSGLLGINHVTLATADLDRLLRFHAETLGATLSFERAATGDDPRIAVVDIGGADHPMLVETANVPAHAPGPLGRAGWGLRVATFEQLCAVRDRLTAAGSVVGPLETLPTQWTVTAHDPDGRPVDIRAHRP